MQPVGLAAFLKLRGAGNRAAAGYMFGVVFFFSLIPIVVALGTNGGSPFLFNVFWRVGIIAMCVAFLLAFYRSTLAFFWRNRRQPQFRRLVRRRFRSAMLWLAVLNGMDYALKPRRISASKFMIRLDTMMAEVPIIRKSQRNTCRLNPKTTNHARVKQGVR